MWFSETFDRVSPHRWSASNKRRKKLENRQRPGCVRHKHTEWQKHFQQITFSLSNCVEFRQASKQTKRGDIFAYIWQLFSGNKLSNEILRKSFQTFFYFTLMLCACRRWGFLDVHVCAQTPALMIPLYAGLISNHFLFDVEERAVIELGTVCEGES